MRAFGRGGNASNAIGQWHCSTGFGHSHDKKRSRIFGCSKSQYQESKFENSIKTNHWDALECSEG